MQGPRRMFVGSYELDSRLQSSPLVHGMPLKARCLTAQVGDRERNKFFVGTLGLREENVLHLIEVVEQDVLEIAGQSVFTHPNEIWDISPCPSDAQILFTCYNTGMEYKASMWKLDEEEATLDEVLQLSEHAGSVKKVVWQPVSDDEEKSTHVVSIDRDSIKSWDIPDGEGSAKVTATIESQKLSSVRWNPHSSGEIAVASDQSVVGFDLRSAKPTFTIPKAHGQCVRDLDFNPNKLYCLVTGGDDCLVKFWDHRYTAGPIRILDGHSHWVCRVEYNRVRDQLLLSSSTDSSVNLWKMVSLSSAPLGIQDESGPSLRPGPVDYLIKAYDEHEHSVYSVAWGADVGSPYVFASLSYDGRVVINQVPYAEVERIQQEEM